MEEFIFSGIATRVKGKYKDQYEAICLELYCYVTEADSLEEVREDLRYLVRRCIESQKVIRKRDPGEIMEKYSNKLAEVLRKGGDNTWTTFT